MLYQWTKFQCHNFFPYQDIKQNVLLQKIQKFQYLENEKRFSIVFLKGYHLVKNKKFKRL